MLPAGGGGYTPIASLPVELLLIILKTVYIDTVMIFDPHTLCEGPCDCKLDWNEGTLTEWNDHDDLTSPSVFPYALASVCKQWYDLMLLVPEFLTRLVIFVDSQPTSTTDLRAQLSASRDRVFEAHITNRQDGIGEDLMERARVQAVVEVLSPHFHRCDRLTFNVMHNSSIPSIRRNFSGVCPLLTELLIECKIHDSKPKEVGKNEVKAPPLFPNLDRIALTGSAFADAYEHPSWLSGIETKRLALCKISHLSSIDVPDLTFFNFLSVLGRFKGSMISLELNHVDLPTFPLVEDLPDDWDYQLDFSSLHLEGLKKETFQEFGHFTNTSRYLESQTIRACELTDHGIGHSYYLDVQDIKNTEELLSVVPTLSSRCVSFVSCGGLNDAVLERLSMRDPYTGEWGLENLQDLNILNSPEISVQGLKRLVKSRIVEASARGYGKDPNYDDFDQMAPIASLSISRCVDFSAVDVQWFKSRVKDFSYVFNMYRQNRTALGLVNKNTKYVPQVSLPNTVTPIVVHRGQDHLKPQYIHRSPRSNPNWQLANRRPLVSPYLLG
ncbi:uncharacterized protein LACBIDRAFT_327562 [Laccaria bicolor S238N-H82]|uniref:Predicted protein n=1 Tax=Laccaria bicolor (strain S238N-H82 / ATCC MYA-4686) TaxID=486041 RepID=B0DC46_LACBS|nr:uncharacterized protein LACBIDRAFT_327562 [Laccaria bicolor S238N-H82]EDR07828.1 predicted protein [Laccaria bicolor S238N-H82]|eukprot:XP_001881617.1 predicted protein [Laccaria bicolor S238N-H82]